MSLLRILSSKAGYDVRLEIGDGGEALASWKSGAATRDYVYKQNSEQAWSRAATLPAGHEVAHIDGSGTPVSGGVVSGEVEISRLEGRSWNTTLVSAAVDGRDKTLLGLDVSSANNLLVHWLSGADLLVAEQRPGAVAGNVPPIAAAGANRSVVEGTLAVALDGSGSVDPDGGALTYHWEQISGPPVFLTEIGSAVTRFDAPLVDADTDLRFRLQVTDPSGDSSVDDVVVKVTDAVPDTLPPVTTLTSSRTQSKGIVKFHLTLSADEPGTTWFQAQGGGTITAGGTNTGEYQTYTGPVDITLNKNGQMTFRYYSVDIVGNTEAWREVTLQ